jgi:hypothetical protein
VIRKPWLQSLRLLSASCDWFNARCAPLTGERDYCLFPVDLLVAV